jgi:RNA polymerase sigma-70 factor (sigma-E family)
VSVDFEAYVATRGPALLTFAYVLTGDAQLAEDLTQTALGQAYRHWRRVERADHPDAYVRKVLVNAHLSWRRRRSSTERPTEDVDPGTVADPANAAADRDETRRLLDQLPPRARAILVLRYYADLDDPSIADLLSIRPSTVRATASRALASLRAAHHPESTVEESR